MVDSAWVVVYAERSRGGLKPHRGAVGARACFGLRCEQNEGGCQQLWGGAVPKLGGGLSAPPSTGMGRGGVLGNYYATSEAMVGRGWDWVGTP